MNDTLFMVFKIVGVLFSVGTLTTVGVILRIFYERKQLAAVAIKTQAEAGDIIITGQLSVLKSATEVASQFGDNVKQLLDHAQLMQDRYEKLVDRHSAETAKLHAEVSQLTAENVKLRAQVEQLTSENESLEARVTALENKI